MGNELSHIIKWPLNLPPHVHRSNECISVSNAEEKSSVQNPIILGSADSQFRQGESIPVLVLVSEETLMCIELFIGLSKFPMLCTGAAD